ncbi:MAG TPA: hypothetical protein VIJ14_05395, partial [Rhabdochlamydiaceae bacterium]
MVQLLSENPSFGSNLVRNFTNSFSGGLNNGMSAAEKFVEKFEKKKIEVDKKKKSQLLAQNSFNEAANLLKGRNLGGGSGVSAFLGNNKVAHDTAAFNTSMGGLESSIRELVNTGKITDTQFKYITQDLLPKSSDREAEIQGKLEQIGKIIGVDIGDIESFNPNERARTTKRRQQ